MGRKNVLCLMEEMGAVENRNPIFVECLGGEQPGG